MVFGWKHCRGKGTFLFPSIALGYACGYACCGSMLVCLVVFDVICLTYRWEVYVLTCGYEYVYVCCISICRDVCSCKHCRYLIWVIVPGDTSAFNGDGI